MGQTGSMLDDAARRFIEAQRIFFVASAPLDGAGPVNLSAKGLDTFRILGPTTVVSIDFEGSGVETMAYLKENERIVRMFCAFQGPPNIFRRYGHGRVVEPHQEKFAVRGQEFPAHQKARSVIVVELTPLTDSCGYGVPIFNYDGEREQLTRWAGNQGPEGLKVYRERKNGCGLDGFPGISV
ncbi:MAG: pyridoxamine 5'-phosphate oxidase family protein [Candidatus Sulfotelmatobacter sp.]